MDILDNISGIEKHLVMKATQARIPISAAFELTPCCNLQCKMCFISMKPETVKLNGGLKDMDFWLRIARELKDLGTLFILLTGGEPMIYPHFRELYRELKKMGFIITLNTNGTCITENIAIMFSEYPPRRVNVTLYGAGSDTYRKLCGRESGFEQCMNGIRLLHRYGIDTKMNVSVVKENMHEFDEILSVADSFGIPVEVNTYMYPFSHQLRGECGATDARLDSETCAKYDLRYWKHKYKEDFISVMKETLSNVDKAKPFDGDIAIYCRAGRSSAWINWRGMMTPCVMMEEPCADLERNSSGEAWQEIVKQVSGLPVYDDCRGCKLKGLCQVCYASASLEKKCNGNLSFLCKITKTEYEMIKKLV